MEFFKQFEADLLVTMIGLLVAGMAAIIGIWVERDPRKPPRYAIWLSVLISLATGVGMFQTWDDDQDQKKVEADLARVLASLDKIAAESDVDIPALNDLIKTEVASASRANPNVVKEMAQRVADEGGDPTEVLAAYLPEGDVQGMQRSGKLAVKPAASPRKPAAAPPSGEGVDLPEGEKQAMSGTATGGEVVVKKRRKLTFGGGAARLRNPGAVAPAAEAEEPRVKPSAPIEAPAGTAEPATAPEPSAVPIERGDLRKIITPGRGPALAPRPGAPAPTAAPAAGPKPAPKPLSGGLRRP